MTRDTATQAAIEHQIGAGGRLSVRVADWDLRFAASPDDVVRVRNAAGGSLPSGIEVSRGPGSLAIRQPDTFRGIGVGIGADHGDLALDVEVPAGTVVDVQSASADVAADGLTGKQRFRTASGDLRLTGERGDLTAETVSGDLLLGVDGAIALTTRTVSGDIRIDGGRLDRLSLSTTSGDAWVRSELGAGPHAVATVSGDVTLTGDVGLRISAVTLTGDIHSELPHTSSGGAGRRSLVIGDGAIELQFRSVSGDLRVVDEPTAGPANRTSGGDLDAAEADRLEILRALEAGEIDVTQATERLAAMDGPGR